MNSVWVFFPPLVIFSYYGDFSPIDEEHVVYQRPPIVYIVKDGSSEWIEKLDIRVKRRLLIMEERLGVSLKERIEVVIPATFEEFNRWTNGRAPYWSGGITYPEKRRIVLKRGGAYSSSLSLETALCHELAHILLYQLKGEKRVPKWLEEGICQILANEQRWDMWVLLGRATITGNLMGLGRAEEVLSFSAPQASLAYLQSQLAASDLIADIGWEGIRKLMANLREGAEFSEAFKEVTGFDYFYWQEAWMERVHRRYRWLVLLDFDNLLWISILFLGVVAAVVIWLKNRRQLKRWEEEEFYEAGYSDYQETDETPSQTISIDNKPIEPH